MQIGKSQRYAAEVNLKVTNSSAERKFQTYDLRVFMRPFICRIDKGYAEDGVPRTKNGLHLNTLRNEYNSALTYRIDGVMTTNRSRPNPSLRL